MKKIIALLLLSINLLYINAFADNIENMPPLMIIRFSEPHIDYKTNLSTIMHKASQIDPSFKIDIEGIFVKTTNYSEDSFKMEMEKVIQTIADSGIKPAHINVNVITKNDTSYPKIIINRKI
jgi:hypothetical protein